jgi:peroxiredoxin
MAGQNPKVRDVPENEKVYWYRTDFWDNVNFGDRRLLRTPVIINKLKRYMKELTPQNPDSVFAAAKHLVERTLTYPEYYKFFANWITIQYEPTKCTLMDPEAVFVNMARNYFTKDRAFWSDSMEVYAIQNRAMEMGQSLVGQKGPNVISTNPEGEQKALYNIDSDYIIVYMFNPQCEHCMEQTPKLVQWHKEWKSKGVEVFAIALDTDQKEWTDYIKKNGMQRFTNVFDPTNRSIYAKYYVDITPELYVLNKDRFIIGKNLKVNQIETIINRDKGLE